MAVTRKNSKNISNQHETSIHLKDDAVNPIDGGVARFKRILPPEPRKIELGDEIFDVGKIPMEITIGMANMMILFGRIDFNNLMALAVRSLQIARPDLNYIDMDWFKSEPVNDAMSIVNSTHYIMGPALQLFFPTESVDAPNESEEEGGQKNEPQ